MQVEQLDEKVIACLKRLPGKISFYYKNLITKHTIEYQAEEDMAAASVIKLFIMAEAFCRIEEGTLSKDFLVSVQKKDCVPSCGALTYMHEGLSVTVLDLITLMIILSDNTATNILIDLLGMEQINKRIQSLGYQTTSLRRKMFELEKSQKGIQNSISAKETADLLERMYTGELISKECSEEMLSIMKNQRLNSKIPFILHTLPESLKIAHKTGEDTGITHDVGIVYAKEPFLICFCGNETEVATYERCMADLSYEIYQSLQ